MGEEMIVLHVVVENVVAEESLDAEDGEVTGTYSVRVPGKFEPGIQAGIAIDLFHRNIPIAVMEDFEITVIEPTTKAELEQSLDYDASSVEGWAGEFLG